MGEIQSRSCQVSVNAPLKDGFQDSRVTSNGALVVLRELGTRFGILRRLFILVRQKTSWSPVVIAGEFCRFLINIRQHREIHRLLKLRPFAEIVQNNPGFAFICLVPNYLGRGFTGTECASCFLHHYRRLHAALPESALRQILQGYITLHEIAEGGNCFALTIGLPEPIGRFEGELSLDLRVNGKKVFNLSFTIVPGWVVKSAAEEILLITRLQGALGSRPQIRLARRAFHEFFPKKLLLAALQGIAEAFGIGELGAICATKQRAYSQEYSTILKSSYDDFFADLGMTKTTAGFYSSPIPIDGRPLASFKGRNRSRARKRRAVRQQVLSACATFLLRAADWAAGCSSGAVNSTPVPGAVESRVSPISCFTPDYKIS
jgi:uncharacterized protein VirK/YbjX